MKKSSFSDRLNKFIAGKGFYIALFLCIAIIGVTSWAILFTGKTPSNNDNIDAMYSSSDIPSGKNYDSTGNSSSSDTDEHSSSSLDSETNPDLSDSSSGSDASSDTSSQSSEDTSGISSQAPETPAHVSAKDAVYVWPVVGQLLTEHSIDALVYNITMADWRTHDGIDVAAEKGATVIAVSDGTVASVYDDDLFGTTVIIDHGNGLKSIYSNLAALPTVSVGDNVTVGEIIGSVGNTAIGEINESSHLHFSMTYNEVSVDPLDYLPEMP